VPVVEPVHDVTGPRTPDPRPSPGAGEETLLSRLFGTRRAEAEGPAPAAEDRGPNGAGRTAVVTLPGGRDALREEIGERVSSGFRDLSRLLVAIKESLQSRDGQVQQTLQALPTYLQQVPKIQRAQIECMAQISKQLEHMGTGTRDMLARLDNVPDLLRSLVLHQQEQARFLDTLQVRTAEALDTQSRAIRQGLETSRQQAETQLQTIRSIASTQEDIFATFQNTQNRALNVFHRAQQQASAQHKETQRVLSQQVEMLVQRVHSAQTRVFWLSIGFAAFAALGLVALLVFGR
jgi:hypothetical protein